MVLSYAWIHSVYHTRSSAYVTRGFRIRCGSFFRLRVVSVQGLIANPGPAHRIERRCFWELCQIHAPIKQLHDVCIYKQERKDIAQIRIVKLMLFTKYNIRTSQSSSNHLSQICFRCKWQQWRTVELCLLLIVGFRWWDVNFLTLPLSADSGWVAGSLPRPIRHR